MLAAAGPLQYQPHPEVWALVAAVAGLGFYVTRVIQPKAVALGGEPVSRRQKRFFVAALAVLWVASDWPVHDLSEDYLYAIHMVQHMVLTLVMPPLFLFATPAWLIRLVFDAGRVGRTLTKLGRPVTAALLYNGLLVLSHAAPIVNASVRIGPLHYVVHALLVLAALLMWNPVCGPVPEMRLNLPAQMAYLFGMSIVPTVPAAFLTVADNPLYRAYERGDYRLWGVTITQDQQAAGLIMKLGGGFYLWGLIIVLFAQWASRHQQAERTRTTLDEQQVLTFEQVRSRFDESEPPSTEVRS